jgi:hypothetical protein
MAAAIRDLAPEDLEWVHALNEAHARELAALPADAFAALVAGARHARIVEEAAAFLLAFDRKPAPVSPNFDWFATRYSNFFYIDRVAVGASFRRRGLAMALYEDLFVSARAAGVERVAAEVNADPPNPASHAFHRRLGFQPVGKAYLADRDKTVTYYLRELG